MNRVCEVLGIEKPVIQGAMAWVATAPLVAAVSNAGGLGVLGVGFAPDEVVIEQVKETRKLTDKPFAINTLMSPENLDRLTGIIKEIKPPVVYCDTLYGLKEDLCRKYFPQWHDAGCKVVVKVCSVAEAVAAENGGAEVVIVKGWEGGGHITTEATSVLIPLVADVVSIPVVASGGIADGRGMAAAIALGAEGVEMGTAFMVCTDAAIHPNVKKAIIEAGDMETVLTGMSTGEACRQFKNELSDELDKIEAENLRSVAAKLIQPLTISTLKKAVIDGDINHGALMVGQIAPLIKEEKSALAIIDDTLSQAKDVLNKIKAFEF